MTMYNNNRTGASDEHQVMMPRGVEPARRSPIKMIWHRRWIIVIAALIGFIGGYVRFHVATPIYTSRAKIYATRSGAHLLDSNQGNANQDNLYTQCQVITSAAILSDAAAVLEGQGLDNLSTFRGHRKLDYLKQNTRATVGKNDEIISVELDTPYPAEAKPILDAVLKAYQDFNANQKHSNAADTVKKLQESVASYHKEVDAKTEEKLKFLRESGLLSFSNSDKGNPILQRLNSLGDALSSAHLDTLNAKTAFEDQARAALNDPTKLQGLISTGQYHGMHLTIGNDDRKMREEMDTAQQLLTELKQRYLPQHPAVQRAQDKVDQLDAGFVLLLHHRWVQAKQREDVLQADFDSAKQSAQDLTIKAAEYQKLEADVAITQRVMDSVEARIKSIPMYDEAESINLRVLEEASEPERGNPTRPVRSIVLFEGLMIGMIVGIALTFLDSRLRSVDEVSAAVGLPILSVIPHMPRRQNATTRGRKVHLEPMSDVAEAFRALRSAVLFGPRAKTVLVTSALRAEGKSTCAANLAIAMAEAGHRVLLVDADLREPTQHKIFATGEGVGLSSVVAGRATLEKAITSTAVKGLELLPCGQVPFNPSETINNQGFADMLTQLGTRYDYLVIDSPPVMPVTDARILGAMCDLTLLVLRAEVTNRRAAADARDGLLGFGANVLGVIVNDGPRKRSRYGYYGGYGLHRHAQANTPRAGLTPQQPNGEHLLNSDLIIAPTRR